MDHPNQHQQQQHWIVRLYVPFLVASIAVANAMGIVKDMYIAFCNTTYDRKHLLSIGTILIAFIFTCIGITMQYYEKKKKNGSSSSSSSCKGSIMRTDCSNSKPTTNHYPIREIMDAKTDLDKFKVCFPMIKQDILTYLRTENQLIDEASMWIDRMIEYNVPGGKLNRGTMVLNVYNTIIKATTGRTGTATPVEQIKACVLGWSIEFLQAFFLVADDVMDDSVTRRGQPCWYKLPNVQLIAVNDSFLLESFVFQILRTHFSTEPYYLDLLELMLDVTQKTEIGQLLDLTSQPTTGNNHNNNNKNGNNTSTTKIDLERFTIERYQKIVQYKTAYYSFYLPVAMGMLMAGIRDIKSYETAKYICCLMGEYFQIQDDHLDCFGDPKIIGKIGTDIQDNKCSWLIVQALQLATPQQKEIIANNYGQWDDKKVTVIKQLYKDSFHLSDLFAKYEEESYNKIQSEMNQNCNNTTLPREMFELFLSKIYKRKM